MLTTGSKSNFQSILPTEIAANTTLKVPISQEILVSVSGCILAFLKVGNNATVSATTLARML